MQPFDSMYINLLKFYFLYDFTNISSNGLTIIRSLCQSETSSVYVILGRTYDIIYKILPIYQLVLLINETPHYYRKMHSRIIMDNLDSPTWFGILLHSTSVILIIKTAAYFDARARYSYHFNALCTKSILIINCTISLTYFQCSLQNFVHEALMGTLRSFKSVKCVFLNDDHMKLMRLSLIVRFTVTNYNEYNFK